MSETFDPNNPFEYIKKLWGTMGLPGMMPPGTSHEEIDRKIADLSALRGELDRIIGSCRHGTVAECKIIETLAPRTVPTK